MHIINSTPAHLRTTSPPVPRPLWSAPAPPPTLSGSEPIWVHLRPAPSVVSEHHAKRVYIRHVSPGNRKPTCFFPPGFCTPPSAYPPKLFPKTHIVEQSLNLCNVLGIVRTYAFAVKTQCSKNLPAGKGSPGIFFGLRKGGSG